MQEFFKLIMNSLYGVQKRKDNNEIYKYKSENWIQTEYDDNVLDSWKLANGKFILKLKKDDGSDGVDNDVKNTLPSHLWSFILCNSKRYMKNFCQGSQRASY